MPVAAALPLCRQDAVGLCFPQPLDPNAATVAVAVRMLAFAMEFGQHRMLRADRAESAYHVPECCGFPLADRGVKKKKSFSCIC
jgi:hypothetical protein